MSFTTLPTIETFGNNDVTTLFSSMGTSDTTVSVVSITGFPTDGQFRLLIDSELILVTGYDSGANQWQVVRGIEGTTAASHSEAAQVVCILTRGGLLQLKADAQANGGNVFVYREGEPDPTGNVYGTFDGAYNAATSTGVPATIVFDDSLGDCFIASPINGSNALLSGFDGTLLTVSGLSGLTPNVVGQLLTIWDAANSSNNGTFTIVSYISEASVQVTNPSAVFPDSNAGSIEWALNIDYNLSQITFSALTPGAYEEPTTLVNIVDGVTFNEGLARVTGGLWVTCGFSVQTFLGTLSNSTTHYMRIDSGSLLVSNETATWDVSQGPTVFVELADGGYVLSNGGCSPFFYAGEGSPGIQLQMGDSSYIDEGFIAGSGGSLTVRVNSPSAVLPTSFEYTGGVDVVFAALASNLQPFAGGGSFPVPGVAPNVTTGTMYYDEGTNQPYWYNGSSWVTFTQVPHIFIFAAGTSPSGNVYASFDAAYAAAVAGGLPAVIGIDDRNEECTLTTNADFDLSQITLTGGFGPNPNTLRIEAGTWNEGFAKITNQLNVVIALSSPTTALITITGPTYSQNAYVENSSSITIGGQGRVWDLSTGDGFNLNLFVGDECNVAGNGSDGQVIWTGAVGSTSIYLGGSPTCSMSSDALGGTSNATLYIGTGALYSPTLPFFTGNLTTILGGQAANLVPYVKSVLQGVTSGQAANLGAGDHVTFNDFPYTQGTNVVLDTSSPYSTVLGQPSVGRITLAANHAYKLVGSVTEAQGSGNFFTQWANASGGGLLGVGTRLQAVTGDNDAPGQAVAFITVGGSPTLVELQVTFNGGITSIGEGGVSLLYPWCTVEEIS